MAQLTIYLDDETFRKITQAAEEERSSVSKWVKKQLVTALERNWPAGYFQIVGSLADEEIERPEQREWEDDLPRCLHP
jgi:hypothetical protein